MCTVSSMFRICVKGLEAKCIVDQILPLLNVSSDEVDVHCVCNAWSPSNLPHFTHTSTITK